MYIRKTSYERKGKRYENYLLVESVSTPQGPRQNVICSLGNLKPRPKEGWLALARKVERALSPQPALFPEADDPEVTKIVRKINQKQKTPRINQTKTSPENLVAVLPDQVTVQESRAAGPVHLGRSIFQRLALPAILETAGFTPSQITLTLALVLQRLCAPGSEHALPGWVNQTALSDLTGVDFTDLSDDALYRQLDRLHPLRCEIEQALFSQSCALFQLDRTVYLYDCTSTYFEGQCLKNPQAKRGYSRDQRSDAKQVVIGLTINRDGFPIAHEVWAGNRSDVTTLPDLFSALEKRQALSPGATVVMDRGLASAENLALVRKNDLHYLVAARGKERDRILAEGHDQTEDWSVLSTRSSGEILVKRVAGNDETHLLVISEGRKDKDRSIRLSQEKRFLQDTEKLRSRVTQGRLKKTALINQAIGRLRERYPRVGRYYQLSYQEESRELFCQEQAAERERAESLDGSYLLKTDRKDLNAEEIWRTYTLLTRAEQAFRDMKSPLAERPIFHQLTHRTETHIFLCVLAYHLLVAIEYTLRQMGDTRSWATIRQVLSTHQVVTVVLPMANGQELHIRRDTVPEETHRDIYRNLNVPEKIMRPVKTLHGVVKKEVRNP